MYLGGYVVAEARFHSRPSKRESFGGEGFQLADEFGLTHNPLQVDYREPSILFRDYAMTEARFSILSRTHPESSERLLQQAQEDVIARYRHYRAQADQPFGKKSAQQEPDS